MASPFLAGFPAGLAQAQQSNADQQYRQTLAAMAQQRMIEMRRQALLDQQKNALLGRSGSGLLSQPAGGNPFGQQLPDYSPGAVQQTPLQPGAIPTDAMTAAALNLIAQDESGGRNIPNYRFDPTHTASGPLQITDSTWNRYAESVGAPKLSYPASPKDRPLAEQYKVGGAIYKNEGFAPWANYNPKLSSDLKQLIGEYRQAGSPIAINVAGMLPPQMIGKAGPGVFAQLVQRIAGADAPDEVKGAALAELLPLMSREGQEQFQQQWEMHKFGEAQRERRREFDIRETELQQQHEFNRTLATERLGQSERKTELAEKKFAEAQQADPASIGSVAKAIANYQMAPLSGWTMRSPWGQQVMAKVTQLNPDYQATQFAARTSAARAFSSGRQSDTVRSMSVAIDHLNTAEQLGEALENGDTRGLNQVKNLLQTQFGYEGPVDFNTAKMIVSDEVTKAVAGGTLSMTERVSLADNLNAASSPEQLHGVISTLKRLLAGQLGGLERQFETGTGQSREEFEKKISPQARQELEGGSTRYTVGQIIEKGGKRYRVIGGDPSDPDVEAVK